MRFKATPMSDLNTGKVAGFLVFWQPIPRARWIPCHEKGKPLFFFSRRGLFGKS